MGASDRNPPDQSLDARVRDLEAVIHRLSLDRFALAGVDLGAATAVAYAVRHASIVSRLVLLSPWVSGQEMFALPDLRVASGMMATGDREWNVFTKEIALDLRISVPTVERHVANLYSKIGARGRVDATAWALRHGLLRLGS
jgi:pimeloyl-ACP methyl ester carboxylesterase